MVFFHFGKDVSSWAVGNGCWSYGCNLGPALKAQWDQLGTLFHDKSMAGTRIEWLSTAPDGSYCLQERNGTIYSNRTDLMQAIRQAIQESSSSWNSYSVDHVSFSPYGAWFLRLKRTVGEGVVQLSSQGRFPDTFIAMASPYLNFSNQTLQPSKVQYAFFGAQDAALIKLSDGGLMWDRLGDGVSQALRDSCGKSSSFSRVTLGKNTVLCPYDANEFFFHLVPVINGLGQEMFRYLLKGDGLTVDLLNAVIQETRPAPNLIPKPLSTMTQSIHRLPTTTQPAPSPAPPPPPPPPPLPARKPQAATKTHAGEEWWADKPAREDKTDNPTDGGEVPTAARDIYEKAFDEHVQNSGRSYIGGFEAAAMMRETGISDEVLHEIWERTDVDGNGKFDREEFVQAMWLITLELARLKQDGVVPQEKTTDPALANNALNAATNFAGPKRTNSMPPNQGNNTQAPQDDQDPSNKLSKQFGDMKLRESLLSSIVSEKPDVQWDDVAGLERAKEELQEAIIFPLRFPQLFKGSRKARRAILLYGPPGTGKSYLAKAVATEVEHTLFSISSGDVMSKWYGDSEGLIRQLFELAREKKPAIIFIDEIDALCSNRDGGPDGGNEHTARMKTEFLVQMDGVGKDNSGVLILAATNLPWSLDPAVRRRFQKRIHVPLPDVEARKQLFKIHLGDLGKNCSERDFAELARRSEGFSGSDVANAIQDGLMVPIKKVHMATHFRKIVDNGSDYYTPCERGDLSGIPMTWKKVPPNKLKEPPLTAEDLLAVLETVKPSVTEAETWKYHEWTNQFGVEGA
ncbi:hypothetical protein VTI74DRAFT_9539 [Chaetomium olivicolor]